MAPKPPALVTPRGTRGVPRFCVYGGRTLDGPRAPNEVLGHSDQLTGTPVAT
jgi:hypothetical protein